MNGTNERSSSTFASMNKKKKKKRRRGFGPTTTTKSCVLAANAFLSITIHFAESFCPVSTTTTHVHRRPRTSSVVALQQQHRRRSWLAFSSSIPTTTIDETTNDDDDDNNNNNNTLLHEQIKRVDPEWYQEYVTDLLGEEYCNNRWPAMDLSAPEKLDSEQAFESDDASTTSTSIGDQPKEPTSDEVVSDSLLEERIDEEETKESLATNDDEEKESKIAQKSREETLDKEAETVIGKTETVLEAQKAEASTNNETRALIYRNITGKKMTCVSLAEILDLGYSVSDLERIQAEFLSIVILDQRKCPSMGVPSQWKIKDPKAKPEVTLMDSMEEAKAIVKELNEKERAETESIQKRRMRQEDRRKEPPSQTESGLGRSSRRENNRSREESIQKPRRRTSRAETPPPSKRQEGRERDRKRRRREKDAPPTDRRRRRDRLDRDGNPRKIYRVPRDDTRSKASRVDDPPDPESPIWVNMDQFRDLLQKEADFRMRFIGEDWSQVIEQENDWREELYKGWLWNLKNGIGESFVPPSRYERARKIQQKQKKPPTQQQQRRRRKGAPEERPRRRRPLEERRELRRRGKPSQQQQQKRRKPDLEPESTDDDADTMSSTRERRSRRRRRGPPSNDR